ncbi:MAG: hypothetical protein ACKO96_18260, partial [Flammeovirgaceae bacterium]
MKPAPIAIDPVRRRHWPSVEFPVSPINNVVLSTLAWLPLVVSNNIWVSGYYGTAAPFTNCTLLNNIDSRSLVNSNAFGT